MRNAAAKAALVVGSLVAFYYIGNFIQHGGGQEDDLSPIREEARCKRAALNEKAGRPDPKLLRACRRKGIIPE